MRKTPNNSMLGKKVKIICLEGYAKDFFDMTGIVDKYDQEYYTVKMDNPKNVEHSSIAFYPDELKIIIKEWDE